MRKISKFFKKHFSNQTNISENEWDYLKNFSTWYNREVFNEFPNQFAEYRPENYEKIFNSKTVDSINEDSK